MDLYDEERVSEFITFINDFTTDGSSADIAIIYMTLGMLQEKLMKAAYRQATNETRQVN